MIKSIETVFKNRRFRSRLEARWAVLFENLGLNWEYEKEGFELYEGVKYLPDFWLPYPDELNFSGYPFAGHWIEIKGSKPTTDEIGKMLMLSIQSNHSGMILVGPPGEHQRFFTHRSGNHGWLNYHVPIKEDAAEWNVFMTFSRFLTNVNHNLIQSAIKKALGARFEYGERG